MTMISVTSFKKQDTNKSLADPDASDVLKGTVQRVLTRVKTYIIR